MKKIKIDSGDIIDMLGEFFNDEIESILRNDNYNMDIIDSYYSLKKVIKSEDMDNKYNEWLYDTFRDDWQYFINEILDNLFWNNIKYDYEDNGNYIYVIIYDNDNDNIDMLKEDFSSDMIYENYDIYELVDLSNFLYEINKD